MLHLGVLNAARREIGGSRVLGEVSNVVYPSYTRQIFRQSVVALAKGVYSLDEINTSVIDTWKYMVD